MLQLLILGFVLYHIFRLCHWLGKSALHKLTGCFFAFVYFLLGAFVLGLIFLILWIA